MDNVRPTLSISELVANRQGCSSKYQILCELTKMIMSENHQDQILLFGEKDFQQWEGKKRLFVEYFMFSVKFRLFLYFP